MEPQKSVKCLFRFRNKKQNMIHDDAIWTVIGLGKSSFCSYKVKTNADITLCRNPYNMTGTCTRLFCPLANSQYATVLEHEDKLYLYLKTAERAHTPLHMWEKVELSSDFKLALKTIDEHMLWWDKSYRLKCKQRVVRLTQMLLRRKRAVAMDDGTEMVRVHKKEERRLIARERKADRAAKVEGSLKEELLKRLRQGDYDSVINCDTEVFNELLDAEEDAEHRKEMERLQEAEDDENQYMVDANEEDEEEEEAPVMSRQTSSVRAKRQRATVTQELEMETEEAPKQKIAVKHKW
eukprot:PhF_6_TR9705/c1_g1_i1/m.14932/K14831/MAK16; protein MAK16